MLATEERCELSDLLPNQCGCPKHRNSEGFSEPRPNTDPELHEDQIGPSWIQSSMYRCPRCHHQIYDTVKAKLIDDDWVHNICLE